MKKIRNIQILIGFSSTLLLVLRLSIEGVSISTIFIGSIAILAFTIAWTYVNIVDTFS